MGATPKYRPRTTVSDLRGAHSTCTQSPSVPTRNACSVFSTCQGPLLNSNTSKQAPEIIGVLMIVPRTHRCLFSR